MRGEIKPDDGPRNKLSAATIVDINGVPKYHVVPTRFVALGLSCMALLFIIAVLLGLLVISNKFAIDNLENKIKVDEETQINDNTNTQDPNRQGR